MRSIFFSLAFLLSTVFADVWRPALIAVCALAAVGFLEQVFHDALPSAWFHVMSAESYFRQYQGQPPMNCFTHGRSAAVGMLRALGSMAIGGAAVGLFHATGAAGLGLRGR
jgi:hypothetical protein